MQSFAFYQGYLITFGILAILSVRAFADGEPHSLQYRLFQGMVVATMACAAVEFLSWLVDGRPGRFAFFAARISSVLLFALNILPIILWVLYLDYQIFQSRVRLRATAFALGAIFAANAAMSVSSLFFDLYFRYGADNVFHRGALHLLAAGLYGGLLAYALILPAAMRAFLPSRLRAPLFLFAVPSVLGVVAQMVWYGANLTWAGAALSLLIVYTSIQSRNLSTDYLTGLFNRRQLDAHLQNRIRNLKPAGRLAVFMFDIDKFKGINDAYGHQVGDQALECAASLLRKTFHHQDFIARYAGDEFAVVLEYSRVEDLDSIKRRLAEKIDGFNASGERAFTLSLSVGTAVYDRESCRTSAELLRRADEEMYAVKRAKALR